MLTLSFFDALTGSGPLARAPQGRSALLALFDWLRARRRARRQYRELLELPDYLLDDVGLTRREVAAQLRRPLI